jgi:outer membrane protein OmpA-like peptidoglycan-associated protein
MHRVTALPARLAALAWLSLTAACSTPDQPRPFTVFFETDSAALTPEAHQVIAEAAAKAHDVAHSKIVIAGRADGSTPHDAALADQRAMAVMQALAAQGVSSGELVKQADAPPSGIGGIAAHQVVITLLP